ncbi:MAG: peptidoglycan-binding protein [Mangrovicoccus sp.]|nr:peptidoglycan-binding protein [Mangrovicoccus sp.]
MLGAAVGHRAANRKDDVRTVQILLNRRLGRAAAASGRRPDLLAEDGRLGPRTQAAILDLQRSIGMAAPDGVVDPDGPTFRHLAAELDPVFSDGFLQLALPAADPDDVARFAPGIAACFQCHGLTTPLRQAHFLAQIGHESGSLRHVEEIASGTAYEGRTDLGNTQPGDGPRFKGRGLIQLTGRANYARFGEAIGRKAEILANPALLATDPALAVEAAGWFWSDRKLNALADRDDLRLITRRINGGLNGLAQRQALLGRIRALYRLD